MFKCIRHMDRKLNPSALGDMECDWARAEKQDGRRKVAI